MDFTDDERDLILAGLFELTITYLEDDPDKLERCNALAELVGLGPSTTVVRVPELRETDPHRAPRTGADMIDLRYRPGKPSGSLARCSGFVSLCTRERSGCQSLRASGYGRLVAIKRIAVGVDGSDGSQHALSWAAELAKSLDAQVLAVNVVPQSWLIELNAFQLKADELIAQRRAKLVGEWTEVLRKQGVGHFTELVRGNPATELLRLAQEYHADLVVVGGSCHHGPMRDSLLGHTSHRVANSSTLPVVVVPVPVDGTETDWVPIPG